MVISLAVSEFDKNSPQSLRTARIFAPYQNGSCPLLNITAQVTALVHHIQSAFSIVKIWEQPSLYLCLTTISSDVSDGAISTLQIYLCTKTVKSVALLDITKLGEDAFLTLGSDGLTTLQSFLEGQKIPKVVFDERTASHC